MSTEVAKHFLFSGTKIIRARRPQGGQDDEAVALAMVVRTGFNTTKGALVRSMLFPKPAGFKFYKDAFRYISVMAAVAGLGFIASFVNFVRLGVSIKLAYYLDCANKGLVSLALNHYPCSGSNHHRCTPRFASNANNRDQFRSIKAEKKEHLLY